MILAAACPCSRSGWLGIVAAMVTDGGTPALLDRWGCEVGHLVELAQPIPRRGQSPQTHERVVTPEEAASIAEAAVEWARNHGATRLRIEAPPEREGGKAAERSRQMAEALEAASLLADIEVESVERPFGGDVREIVGWPREPGATKESEQRAALLLLPREDGDDERRLETRGRVAGRSVGRSNSGSTVSRRDQPEAQPGGADKPGAGQDSGAAGNVVDRGGGRCEGIPEDVRVGNGGPRVDRDGHSGRDGGLGEGASGDRHPHGVAPPPKLGHRIAAIDSGTRHICIGISEGTTRPLRLVGFEHLDTDKIREVGKDDPPRMGLDGDRDAAVEWAVDVLLRYEVDEVVVELPRSVHVVRGKIHEMSAETLRALLKRGQATAANVLRMSIVAGEIRRAAKMAGLCVLESVPEATWSAVVGGRKRDGADGTVRQRKRAAVADPERGFVDWPDVEGERRDDRRDVGGMCLYVVDTYHTPKPERAGRASTEPGTSKPRAERRKESARRVGERRKREREEARAALVSAGKCIGCPRRHRIGCPSYVPKRAEDGVDSVLR